MANGYVIAALRIGDNWVITSATRLVLVALAHHADEKGHCSPDVPLLAGQLGIGENQFRTHIRKLIAMGMMTRIIQRRPDGKRRANAYKIILTNIGK